MKHIPIAGPWITQKEINYVTDAVTNAWYENSGLYNKKLEDAFAKFLGVQSTATLPSCTSGIHLALAALKIGPGDEVIVPEVTWIASAAPINYVGATPVFVDVDPVTWCMCPKSFENAITDRTKAVICVDLYGNLADYDAIRAISEKHGIKIIEDTAEAVGATKGLRPAGSFGDVSVFSFHGSKTLTTGEGGLIATNDTELMERINFLRDHGRSPGDFSFENREVAFKYKMSSMQAALGLAQLERVDEIIARKRQAFGWYHERLSALPGIQMNDPGPNVESAYWLVSIVWDESHLIDKKQVRDVLATQGIDTRPFFSPLSSLLAYKNLPNAQECQVRNPVSYRLMKRGVNLPSSLALDESTVDYVCHHVKKIFVG